MSIKSFFCSLLLFAVVSVVVAPLPSPPRPDFPEIPLPELFKYYTVATLAPTSGFGWFLSEWTDNHGIWEAQCN